VKLLLLAGTGDARRIATALAPQPGVDLIASLAGETRHPAPIAATTRIGGFGGPAGFAAFLAAENIRAVVDATHPFARQMSATAAGVCAAEGIPHLRFLRPPWKPGRDENWVMVGNEQEVAAHIPAGAVVFLATGRKTLDSYANLGDCRLICRQIDPPERPFPFPNGRFLLGRPPFSVGDETALFEHLGVDWLVVRNSGGTASRSKLDAAAALGIRVAMIRRPVPPDCRLVASVPAVVAWVREVGATA